MRFVTIILSIAAVSLLSATIFAQGRNLVGEDWVLTEMNGNPVGNSAAFIKFGTPAGRFGGNTGCNIMSGNARIRGNKITFSDVITSKRACMQGKPSLLDGQVSRIFGQTVKYSLRRGILTLAGGNGLVLKFRQGGRKVVDDNNSASSALEARKWMLESVAGKAVGKEGKEAFVVFDPAKRSAGGNTSCNVFGGSYTATGSKLKITETISTMRACIEDDRMNIERGFLDGLQDVDRYEVRGDKLYLFKGSRQLLAFFGTDK